jgi:2-dehydropantoate 2-reductase
VRFVVYGAGAIGGGVGARLFKAGHEVTLIARGEHYQAIADAGLTFETPAASEVLRIPVADDPAAVDWSEEHVVLLCTKTQDSFEALGALAQCAPPGVSIACLQNGVANERIALRLFASVYGAVVMMPATHLEPGVVQAYGTPLTGVIDVGRYPSGLDERCAALGDALSSATFSSRAYEQIMRSKYAKLLGNLANAVEAICGLDADGGEVVERAREEGRRVLQAAGIEFEVDEDDATRRRGHELHAGAIGDRKRGGSSTWQSIERGTGSAETDYLNGEIVLLGRLHDVPAPVNEHLQELVREMIREAYDPGWLSPDEVLARLG